MKHVISLFCLIISGLPSSAICQIDVSASIAYAQSAFSAVGDFDHDTRTGQAGYQSFDKYHYTTGLLWKGGIHYEICSKLSIGARALYLNSSPTIRTLISTDGVRNSSYKSKNFSIGPSFQFHWINFSDKWSVFPSVWFPIQVKSVAITKSTRVQDGGGIAFEYDGRTRVGLETAMSIRYRLSPAFGLGGEVAFHAASFNSRTRRRYDIRNGEYDPDNPTSVTEFEDIGKRLPRDGSVVPNAGHTVPFSHLSFSLTAVYHLDFADESDQPRKPKRKSNKQKRRK